MKPTFHAEVVNKPFQDPVLFVRSIYNRGSILFDLGNIDSLDTGKLNTVSDIFVTHMHIDHFIGFDTALRTLLKRDGPLSIYGPKGIIGCIEGKLRGYTWNLIRDYPLMLEVYEINEETINHASFYANEEFRKVMHPPYLFNNPIKTGVSYHVNAIILSHQIPVAAYCLEEDIHININKAMLQSKGLPVGPWLSQLKDAVRSGEPDDYEIRINETVHRLRDLRELIMLSKGQKLCYVMDIAPTEENISRLLPFISGADCLYCEAFFSESETERAIQRNHLTAAMAGRIARMAGVKRLVVMHFSQKYNAEPEWLVREAEREFKGL